MGIFARCLQVIYPPALGSEHVQDQLSQPKCLMSDFVRFELSDTVGQNVDHSTQRQQCAKDSHRPGLPTFVGSRTLLPSLKNCKILTMHSFRTFHFSRMPVHTIRLGQQCVSDAFSPPQLLCPTSSILTKRISSSSAPCFPIPARENFRQTRKGNRS